MPVKAKRKPKTKRFLVTFTAEIELSEDILKTAQSDEWRSQFFDLNSNEEVAMFVGRLLALSGHERINQIDGFADKPDSDPSRLIEFRAEEATEDMQ